MVELGANDIDEQQTAHLANARDKSLVDGATPFIRSLITPKLTLITIREKQQ